MGRCCMRIRWGIRGGGGMGWLGWGGCEGFVKGRDWWAVWWVGRMCAGCQLKGKHRGSAI